ncbi:MAG TPA: hypothetical protein VE077_05035 [Candidatus Methylomirabilis sp.]|nr:hypothetical protein [Candidatus Methylomirabilis sp.]
MKTLRLLGLFLAALMFNICTHSVSAQSAPTVAAPYQLTVFAQAPSGLSAPDSIAVLDGHVFVGYGDGHDPAGADGKSSQIVEYNMDGSMVRTFTVLGHSDGLKVDPVTHLLWALQNEDGNARLVILNPETGERKLFLLGTGPHGGGYDDITFRGCQAYISASNPANSPNTAPAIVSAHFDGNHIELEPVLAGNTDAIDIPTGATTTLNLQDPDSMTLDPLGNIVLDSQGDQELIIVSDPGSANQRVLHLPLTYMTPAGAISPVEVDDTNFATSTEGFILFADKGLNAVYKLTANAFAPGAAYTAADGGHFVGTLDLSTGLITPIVTGLSNPGGLVFVNTSKRDRDQEGDRDRGFGSCRDRDHDFGRGF